MATSTPSLGTRALDPESQAWLERLRGEGATREEAVAELHGLLHRAARFEIGRRRDALGERYRAEQEDLAQQSADDALLALLSKLEEFRGESRFTTWAYKFALYEAAVKVRRRAWQDREVQLEAQAWSALGDDRQAPDADAETRELLAAIATAIESQLSPRQREVLVAVTLQDVPIDVLAERLQTSRGALYKTLHDARRKLRAALDARGLAPARQTGGER